MYCGMYTIYSFVNRCKVIYVVPIVSIGSTKYFPKERYCTCVYLCNLIIIYGYL